MNRIQFPNPNDADDLNDVLDALTAGAAPTHIEPTEEQRAAEALYALARAAKPPYRLTPATRKETLMSTALAANANTGTRPHQRIIETNPKPSTFSQIAYTTIAALLLVAIVGAAWLNQPAGPPQRDSNIAYVPANGVLDSNAILQSDEDAWMADFDRADCEFPQYTKAEYEERVSAARPQPQEYGVTGPAEAGSATDVAEMYRDMRGCLTYSAAWNYWSDARIAALPRSLTEANMTELAALQEHFATVYPDQFMAAGEGIEVPDEVQAEWTAREQAGLLGQPIPIGDRINPEWGVELSDGRVAFPATILYAANDPAIVANGLPTGAPVTTVVIVFTYENDAWKYDDSLPLCLENCLGGIGNPFDLATDPRGWTNQDFTCDVEPLSPDDYRTAMTTMPDWQSRGYRVIGPAKDTDVAAAWKTYQSWGACHMEGKLPEARGQLSPLGLLHYSYNAASTHSADELRAYAISNAQASQQYADTLTPVQEYAVVINAEPGFSEFVEMDDWHSSGGRNEGGMRWPETSHRVPASALELSDGRVIVQVSRAIDISDRGGLVYAGETGQVTQFRAPAIIMVSVDGEWKIDESMDIVWYVGMSELNTLPIYSPLELRDPMEPAATPEATPAN